MGMTVRGGDDSGIADDPDVGVVDDPGVLAATVRAFDQLILGGSWVWADGPR